MAKKIENEKEMTLREACEKYKDKFIGFILVDHSPRKAMDYVVKVCYTVDSYRDQFDIPSKTECGNHVTTAPGKNIYLCA